MVILYHVCNSSKVDGYCLDTGVLQWGFAHASYNFGVVYWCNKTVIYSKNLLALSLDNEPKNCYSDHYVFTVHYCTHHHCRWSTHTHWTRCSHILCCTRVHKHNHSYKTTYIIYSIVFYRVTLTWARVIWFSNLKPQWLAPHWHHQTLPQFATTVLLLFVYLLWLGVQVHWRLWGRFLSVRRLLNSEWGGRRLAESEGGCAGEKDASQNVSPTTPTAGKRWVEVETEN